MTERTWFDGDLPAIATGRLAVLVDGPESVPAARRVLRVAEASTTISDVLDALVADGLGSAPAFALVALEDRVLTAFLRGAFALRFEDAGGRVWRLDGTGAHTWREVSAAGVTRAWAGSPAAEPRIRALGRTPERPLATGPATASGVGLWSMDAAAPTPRPTGPAPRAAETPRLPHAIVLPGGERVPIEGTLLVGRGPRTERVDAAHLPTLVPLPRAARDVSRSHVRIWSDGDRVQIEDLATSGGTALIEAGGTTRRLVPERPAEVIAGTTAELAGGARIRFVGDE